MALRTRAVQLVGALLLDLSYAAPYVPLTQLILPAPPATLDGLTPGWEYTGHGAISSGGSSRLLYDFPEPQRSQLLDLLFLQGAGASIQMLKIEIGGDGQSGQGTEPSHLRQPGLAAACNRGFELWLVREARRRNPSLQVYAMTWSAPSWVGVDEKNRSWGFHQQIPNPTTGNMEAAGVTYLLSWLECVQQVGAGPINFLGTRNGHAMAPAFWIQQLRASLDEGGFNMTELVLLDAPDSTVLQNSLAVSPLRGVVGIQYPCYAPRPQLLQAGFQLWSTEDGNVAADWSGAGCLGRTLNQNFVKMNMTTTLMSSLIWAVYPGLVTGVKNGLLEASQPWSGTYEIQPPVWVLAHTTQFVQVGWTILDAGSGSGRLSRGGSYVTYVSPNRSDFVIVIEKLHGACSACPGQITHSEQLQFVLAGGLDANFIFPLVNASAADYNLSWTETWPTGTTTDSYSSNATAPASSGPVGKTVSLWITNSSHYLFRLPDLVVDPGNASFSFFAAADSIYTISSSAKPGLPAKETMLMISSNNTEPAAFPLPWADAFDSYPVDSSARYFFDVAGSWQVTADPNDPGNQVLTQGVLAQAGPNAWVADPEPITYLGDSLGDVSVSVDIFLPPAGDVGSPPTAAPASSTQGPAETSTIRSAWDGRCLESREEAFWTGTDIDASRSCTQGRGSQFLFDEATGLLKMSSSDRELCVSADDDLCDKSPAGAGPTVCLSECLPSSHRWSANQTWTFHGGALQLAASPGLCLTALGEVQPPGIVSLEETTASPTWFRPDGLPSPGLAMLPCSGPPGSSLRQKWLVPGSSVGLHAGVCIRLSPPILGASERAASRRGYCFSLGLSAVRSGTSTGSEASGVMTLGPQWSSIWLLEDSQHGVILASGLLPAALGAWHNVVLSARGSQIQVLLDREVVANVVDRTHSVGMVGLISSWTMASFDNFLLSPA